MAEPHTERQTTEPHVPHAPGGHERSDVTIRPLMYVVGILIGITVIVMLALWGAIWSFERTAARSDPQPSPVASVVAPPQPRLQPTLEHHPTLPHEDTLAMRMANERILKNYGWRDRERGVVHIPIDAAMRRLVEQSRAGEGAPEEVQQ